MNKELTSIQKKILELQNKKKDISNSKEQQKRIYLISMLNSACKYEFENSFDVLKYNDIDFKKYLNYANNDLEILKENLLKLKNIPKNSVEIQMTKDNIKKTLIRIKHINLVKDNLLEIENKCFENPLL